MGEWIDTAVCLKENNLVKYIKITFQNLYVRYVQYSLLYQVPLTQFIFIGF